MKIESPPDDVIEQERREALDTVRRAMAQPGVPVVSDNNPLGLLLDANGQAPTLRIVTPEGEGVQARQILCNRFCQFLANREEYLLAFN